jgi:hypothetical protein
MIHTNFEGNPRTFCSFFVAATGSPHTKGRCESRSGGAHSRRDFR